MKKEKKVKGKLPGTGWRILSWFPGLNWIALIYIGLRRRDGISVLCGVVYGIISFARPSTAWIFWIIAAIQCAVIYRKMKKNEGQRERNQKTHKESPQIKGPSVKRQETGYGSVRQEAGHRPVKTEIADGKEKSSDPGYTDVVLSGEDEKKQAIPSPKLQFDISYSGSSAFSSGRKFFRDMKRFEDRAGDEAPFVPFMAYWPEYDNMDRQQQAWYFYWRTQVRSGIYPDTDLSYIFVHVYELLSGCGWREAGRGYEQLMSLWTAYRQRFPKLDSYLFGWTFDFAQLHGLKYTMPEDGDMQLPYQQAVRDILIDRHREDKPLKLPFVLIDAMCDYSLAGSKFYKDGHQLLMQEAIPRVVALADAALLKKKDRGILAVYGPNRPRKQSYCAFQSAVCPDANRQMEVSVRAYTSSEKLRGYINELVRYGENVLRSLYGCRGRLRGVSLDEETAALVETFLKKEYTPGAGPSEETPVKAEVKLDFSNIDELRVQSDAVREALEVREDEKGQKELLTELQEVRALWAELASEERALLDILQKENWECRFDPENQRVMDGINRLANKYLACALLVLERGQMLVEDDYRDELDYIYANRTEISETSPAEEGDGFASHLSENGKGGQEGEGASRLAEAVWFDLSALSDDLKQVVENLTLVQQEALWTITFQEHPQQRLQQIADRELTMPEMLIDEINDTAAQFLDDILIEALEEEPYILEQYAPELKGAMAAGSVGV